MQRWWFVAVVMLIPSLALAKQTDAEKAKAKAEKKLEAFMKEYDTSKDLSRKANGFDKDVEALDKEIEALTALDAAAGAELKARRDSVVEAAKTAVSGASAGKTSEAIDKKLEKIAKEFDPEKKKLNTIDPKSIERARKELDDLIAKLDGDTKASYEAKRDELFKKIDSDIGGAKTERRRKGIEDVQPVAAVNGAETIAAMAPTWCEGVLEARGKQLENYFPPTPSEWTGRITDAITFSCVDAEWDVRQRIVAAWRQKMGNALGLTAANNERLMKLGAKIEIAQLDKGQKGFDRLHCDVLKPNDSGTASERANRALERIVMGCGNGLSRENAMRMIDIDTPGSLTSQLATAGAVFRILGDNAEAELSVGAASDVAVANTLTWDPAAFETQLGALKLNFAGEATALIAYYGQRQRLNHYNVMLREVAKKSPALTKMVFDAPAQAAKDYTSKRAAADKPVLDLVLAMEAQAGPINGCAKKLWPFLVEELKGQAKSAVSDLKISGLLAWALTECARRDEDAPVMESLFSYWAERTTAVRGPLTAAYLAYVDAYNDASAGQSKQTFDENRRAPTPGGSAGGLPAPRRNPLGEAALSESRFGHLNAYNPSSPSGGGVVKAVEKKGATVKISFRTEKFMVPDYNCVETNKIDRIAADGTILYRRNCTKVGEHEESATIEPVEVPTWAAGGVGPGSYITPLWASVNGGAAGHAWILEAFDSKARGKRTSLLGIAQ